MINIPPIKQSTAIKVELIPDISKTWKVGQILNATAKQGGDALSDVLIQVGKYTLQAKTPISLQSGQDIKLQIKSLPDGQTNKLPQLNILPTSTPSTQTATLAALKLRQFIAIQQSLTQVIQLSDKLLNNKLASAKLPDNLKNMLNRLQTSLQINAGNINAAQLKQQILDSGVFLESKLLNQKTNPQSGLINDFKYQLLAIKENLALLNSAQPGIGSKGTEPAIQPVTIQLTAQQLNQLQSEIKQAGPDLLSRNLPELADKLMSVLSRPSLNQLINLLGQTTTDTQASNELQTLAKFLVALTQQQPLAQQNMQHLLQQLRSNLIFLELGQQIEQSISKITSLQLQPLSREGDNLVLLLFNLIFKDNNEQFDLNFRIQQQNKETDQSQENWLVTVSFNFKTLGKVQSKIHMIDNRVSSVFYTELGSTADKIKTLLPLLETGFKKAGLTVVNLAVKNNLPDDKQVINHQVNLLDENV
ncbi:hypothetical protein MNBD_GAMMA09-913 [hydrothermal vent metagenome]|uniref:Flagellar hook-length control protein-like C-terminal domain-containing protein n=1 Tax=hydrothermal vent metagenome TaxID=652676 RepID=A0A3B0XJX2_9ZZZZ